MYIGCTASYTYFLVYHNFLEQEGVFTVCASDLIYFVCVSPISLLSTLQGLIRFVFEVVSTYGRLYHSILGNVLYVLVSFLCFERNMIQCF